MNDAKYIGLDVHQATVSVAILDSAGKLMMEAYPRSAGQFACDLRRRNLCRVVARSAQAARCTSIGLRPVQEHSGKVGNKNDRNDALELAELLYRNKLKPVYHGEHGVRTLKDDPLFLPQFAEQNSRFPDFTAHHVPDLTVFLDEQIHGGDSGGIAAIIEQRKYRPSKKLLDMCYSTSS